MPSLGSSRVGQRLASHRCLKCVASKFVPPYPAWGCRACGSGSAAPSNLQSEARPPGPQDTEPGRVALGGRRFSGRGGSPAWWSSDPVPGRAVFPSRPSKQKLDVRAVTANPGVPEAPGAQPLAGSWRKTGMPTPREGVGSRATGPSLSVCERRSCGQTRVPSCSQIHTSGTGLRKTDDSVPALVKARRGKLHTSHLPSIFFLRAEELLFSLILKAIHDSYIRK